MKTTGRKYPQGYVKASSNSPKYLLISEVDGERDTDKFYSDEELINHFREFVGWIRDKVDPDIDMNLLDINSVQDAINFIQGGPYDTGWGYMPGCYWSLYDSNMDEIAYGEM